MVNNYTAQQWVPWLRDALRQVLDEGPVSTDKGICNSVDRLMSHGLDGFYLCALVFSNMGYDRTWPLGDSFCEGYFDNDPGNHWTGEYGERRMALVQEMLDYLEAYYP